MKLGVVLFQLGGPDSLENIQPFLYNLFCDPDIIDLPLAFLFRKPLARLISSKRAPIAKKLYASIGGGSPILEQTQMQADALVATGTIDFNVGHPIAFFPCPVANMVCVVDGINTAFNLTNIFDIACLALLDMPKPATTATNYNGLVTVVAE